MGNGQSGSGNGSSGVPSSVSFLSNKKSNSKTKGKVVVVRQWASAGGPSNSETDVLLKRFSEIPKFYPLLRGALKQPGLRDPPETISRISARPILKFAYRIQEHLSQCANVVAMEQDSLGKTVKDLDHAIAVLLMQFSERKKTLDRFQSNLEKIGDLQAHISNLRFLFEDVMPVAETLNEILPAQRRLPALKIRHLVDEINEASSGIEAAQGSGSEGSCLLVDNGQTVFHIKPADELAVADRSNV